MQNAKSSDIESDKLLESSLSLNGFYNSGHEVPSPENCYHYHDFPLLFSRQYGGSQYLFYWLSGDDWSDDNHPQDTYGIFKMSEDQKCRLENSESCVRTSVEESIARDEFWVYIWAPNAHSIFQHPYSKLALIRECIAKEGIFLFDKPEEK